MNEDEILSIHKTPSGRHHLVLWIWPYLSSVWAPVFASCTVVPRWWGWEKPRFQNTVESWCTSSHRNYSPLSSWWTEVWWCLSEQTTKVQYSKFYSRDITYIISFYDWNINTCSYKFVLRSQKPLHVICTNPYNQQRTIQMSAHRLTAMIVESGKL